MPSKRVIILDRLEGGQRFRYALWADVPVTRQSYYAQAGKKSMWTAATALENTAIELGQVAERVETISRAGTLVDIQAELQGAWQTFQDEITAANPWRRYGTYLSDQGAWVAGGVA